MDDFSLPWKGKRRVKGEGGRVEDEEGRREGGGRREKGREDCCCEDFRDA